MSNEIITNIDKNTLIDNKITKIYNHLNSKNKIESN